MNGELISILMPVKNTENYLTECLNSILSQTEINWELIAVDDFSDDKSWNILNDFANKDIRIKPFKNQNSGIIGALQLAFSKSVGQLITRMDSDDIMTPIKLEVLKANLLKSGTNHIAVGGVTYFSEKPLGEGFKKYEVWLNNLSAQGNNFSEIYKECVIPSPCWMIHRSDLMFCDAFNPNFYPEDYDLAFRFFKNGFKVIPCLEKIHMWRDYSNRTSRTHVHYADHSFIEIKTKYFLELHYNSSNNLIIWGAGDKGKKLAQLLINKNIPFNWICDNPKKIGKEIFGKIVLEWQALDKIDNAQSIITVANTEAQKEIKNYFTAKNLQHQKDYFFFC